MKTAQFATCFELISNFTCTSLRDWNACNNSINFLLTLWSRMTCAFRYVQITSAIALNQNVLANLIPRIVEAYIEGRLLQVLDDGHLARKPMQKRLVEDRKEHGGDERRADYAQIVLAASITPHDLVDPERPKADDEQDRGDRQRLEGVDNDLGAYDVCLTENDRSHIAYANHERVRDEHRPFAERAYAVRLLLDLDLDLLHLPSPAIPLRRCSSSLLFSYLCLLSAHYRSCDALSRRSRWGC